MGMAVTRRKARTTVHNPRPKYVLTLPTDGSLTRCLHSCVGIRAYYLDYQNRRADALQQALGHCRLETGRGTLLKPAPQKGLNDDYA